MLFSSSLQQTHAHHKHTHEHTIHHSKRRLYAEPWLYPVFNFPGESIVAFVSLWMRFTCTNIYASIHFQVKTWMRSLCSNVQTFFEIPCRWFPSWTDWLTGNMYAPLFSLASLVHARLCEMLSLDDNGIVVWWMLTLLATVDNVYFHVLGIFQWKCFRSSRDSI